MNSYDWELIELLLHKVQESANVNFAPREYAAELAEQRQAAGRQIGGTLDHLKMLAADYERILLQGGYIESRPESEGGNGENFVLTERGSRLLELTNSSLPANLQFREQLAEKGQAALTPEVFDELSAKAARA
ncbi:transcriptional regulator [Pseudomonas sp. TUM22785]|uniref:transcriptional regulator n=1 Tax=Pseudomonas sp. TUM22785 TaxID=3019098 RepID=UPI002305077D|nr:transcriptional regulator [Pseudomonas sp. TUM22785]WCD82040.1 transcriptional regulator [Pseudomonas sp. TUM22785]